jgi:hypothetical protein
LRGVNILVGNINEFVSAKQIEETDDTAEINIDKQSQQSGNKIKFEVATRNVAQNNNSPSLNSFIRSTKEQSLTQDSVFKAELQRPEKVEIPGSANNLQNFWLGLRKSGADVSTYFMDVMGNHNTADTIKNNNARMLYKAGADRHSFAFEAGKGVHSIMGSTAAVGLAAELAPITVMSGIAGFMARPAVQALGATLSGSMALKGLQDQNGEQFVHGITGLTFDAWAMSNAGNLKMLARAREAITTQVDISDATAFATKIQKDDPINVANWVLDETNFFNFAKAPHEVRLAFHTVLKQAGTNTTAIKALDYLDKIDQLAQLYRVTPTRTESASASDASGWKKTLGANHTLRKDVTSISNGSGLQSTQDWQTVVSQMPTGQNFQAIHSFHPKIMKDTEIPAILSKSNTINIFANGGNTTGISSISSHGIFSSPPIDRQSIGRITDDFLEAHRIQQDRMEALLPEGLDPDFPKTVKKVFFLLSSPRGGSSVLAKMLQLTPLRNLKGEFNPLLRASETFANKDVFSDVLHSTGDVDMGLLGKFLHMQAGNYAQTYDIDEFAQVLRFRLSMQWTNSEFKFSEVATALQKTSRSMKEDFGWPENQVLNDQLFHSVFIKHLQETHPEVHPGFYDINYDKHIKPIFGDIGVPETFSTSHIIEVPPYITISPWENQSVADKPLFLKAPNTAYRLDFMQELFPNAEIKFIHLTRDWRASVNGLFDSWGSNAFHSYKLGPGLNIGGYSDKSLNGELWWKHDLPPGWQNYIDKPLEDVAAFQWASAHNHILEFTENNANIDVFRLSHESNVNPETRHHNIHELVDWLGVESTPQLESFLDEMPLVMATKKPKPERWRERADIIEPLINNKDLGLEEIYEKLKRPVK